MEFYNGSAFGLNEPTINVTSPPIKICVGRKLKTGMLVLIWQFWIIVSFTVDAYYRKSEDLIGARALPLENGFSSSTMNWAEVSNKGY